MLLAPLAATAAIAFAKPSGIYVMQADGAAQRRFLPGGTVPVWSPDRRWITWVQGRSHQEVWTARSDGTQRRRVFSRPKKFDVCVNAFAPAQVYPWSPDSRTVAFVAGCEIEVMTAWVVRRDGGGLRPLARLPAFSLDVCWRPDGRLSFLREIKPYGPTAYFFDGSRAPIPHATIRVGNFNGCWWTPDGTRLVRTYLDVFRPGTGRWRQIDIGDLELFESDLSPDGRTIAFTAKGADGRAVYTIPLSGGTPTRVTDPIPDTPPLDLSWSPDGTRLLFDQDRKVVVIDADGTNRRELATGFWPRWIGR